MEEQMTDKRTLSEKRADAGKRGGKARVPKGTARMPEEKVLEISKKGVEARQRKNEN
jgi:hypothetical protein